MKRIKGQQIPVIKNGEYEIEIENLGSKGEGIGRINGFTMFVPASLPGEKVLIRVLKVQKRFGYGKVIKILRASEQRVKPPCPYFYKCGGCQLQHMIYKTQLDYKRQSVKDVLERIGGIKNPVVKDTLGMSEPWHYRNKMQFPVGTFKDKPVIGPFAPRSHNIIDVDLCMIQKDISIRVSNILREFMEDYKIAPYMEERHSGLIRHIVTKVGFTSGELMVILVTKNRYLPEQSELIKRLRDKIPSLVSIVQNINSKRTNLILGKENILLWGKDHIIEKIRDLNFKISPLSFFQVNPIQMDILYRGALEYANLKGNELVIDAYCGIGAISLFISQRAKKVYGIESIAEAVEDARENALMNGIKNAEFVLGQAEKIIPQMIEKGLKPQVVFLDPPRKGCDPKLLEAIIKASPEKIVYVSCNPATLARDLKYLLASGDYRLVEAQPVDMFPQTVHVETVVLMSRK